MAGAKSAGCRCASNFTCGHCLRNAKPWFFAPRKAAHAIAEAAWNPKKVS